MTHNFSVFHDDSMNAALLYCVCKPVEVRSRSSVVKCDDDDDDDDDDDTSVICKADVSIVVKFERIHLYLWQLNFVNLPPKTTSFVALAQRWARTF